MAKQSTNKWSLERARKTASILEKAGTDPQLLEVLNSLLWVVDHQQDQLEQMYAWTKYSIEQALVDHARGDGTVQINESCHAAIKAWWHTDGVADTATSTGAEEQARGEPLADGERETFVSIPRNLWFRWERWCELNGYEPRHRLVVVMRLWTSDRTLGELGEVADTPDANKE